MVKTVGANTDLKYQFEFKEFFILVTHSLLWDL
jgi:hypothetical protein